MFTFQNTHIFPGFRLLMALGIAGCGLLASCSADEAPSRITDQSSETAGLYKEISFDFSINSEESTRSGRVLWSRAPRQQVNDMKLYVFKEMEGASAAYHSTLSVTEFLNVSPNYTQTESVKVNGSFDAGSYTFLAVGYESDYDETTVEVESGKTDPETGEPIMIKETHINVKDNATYGLPELKQGLTTINDMLISLADPSGNADEVFAGIKEGVEIGGDSKPVKGGHIVLNRVTAGVLAYLEKIPYELSDTEGGLHRVMRVDVEMAAKGLSASLLAPFDAMGKTSGRYALMSFNVSGFEKDGENNWYRIPAYNWSAEGLDEKPEGVIKKANSVLGGRFILPFVREEGVATLRVALYGGDSGDEMLKHYDVICKEHSAADDYSGTIDHDSKVFDILANHYYSLGVKYSDSGYDPDDPEHPEPFEPDEPIDLSKEQIIVITVDPSWDKRHDMTL